MPEEGYLEELNRPQGLQPVIDAPSGVIVGFAWVVALVIMVALWPFCFVLKMAGRRGR